MRFDEDEKCESAHTLSVIAAIAGVIGLAYLGYRKRDSIDWDKLSQFKARSRYVFEPLVKGAKSTKNRVNDAAQDAKDGLTNSFDEVLNTLNTKVEKLSGSAKQAYIDEVKELKERFLKLQETK